VIYILRNYKSSIRSYEDPTGHATRMAASGLFLLDLREDYSRSLVINLACLGEDIAFTVEVSIIATKTELQTH
jgi:hypothetical protein